MFPLQVVSFTVTFPLTFNKPGPLIALMLDAGMFSVSLTFKLCVSVSVWLSGRLICRSSIVPEKFAVNPPAPWNRSVPPVLVIAPFPVSVAVLLKTAFDAP